MPCSFDEHLARGSRGGVDFAVGVGSPVFAPTLGVVENATNSSAGNYVNFRHIGDNGQPTGFYDQFMHLSRFVAPGWYQPGSIIGYSGNTGSSTGPHIHWDLVNPQGKVVRQWEYFHEDVVTSQEKIVYYIQVKETAKKYIVGQEFVHLMTTEGENIVMPYILGAGKEFGGHDQMKIFCKSLGIPTTALEALSKTAPTWSKLDTISGGGGATPAQIAAAVDASLKDDFAAIPKTVNDDVAKRMSS